VTIINYFKLEYIAANHKAMVIKREVYNSEKLLKNLCIDGDWD
jgi:hypothetical protein